MVGWLIHVELQLNIDILFSVEKVTYELALPPTHFEVGHLHLIETA